MRIDRMCVRRLKTTGSYENIAIELCADVSLNDDLDAVYEALLTRINEFIELLPDIEKAAKLLEDVNRAKKELEQKVSEIDSYLTELHSLYERASMLGSIIKSAINELRNVVDQANQLVEESKNKKGLLEKLKILRKGG